MQLAKARGARVIGTAAGADRAYVEQLGADQVIDYQTQQVAPLVIGVDVVLDLVGGPVQVASWPVLRPGGLLISTVQPPTLPAGVRGQFLSVQPSGAARYHGPAGSRPADDPGAAGVPAARSPTGSQAAGGQARPARQDSASANALVAEHVAS